MYLNACLCVFVHSRFVENPLIAILATTPLISEVGMSQLVSELYRGKYTLGSTKNHDRAYGEERLAHIRTIVVS